MDDQSATVKVEDTSFSSKSFPSNLQPVEFVAVECKVKTEPLSEEAETEVRYQSVPSFGVAEDGEMRIKVERVDASSEELDSPGEGVSLCTDGSHFMDTGVIVKEEDLGVCSEEGEGLINVDLNSSVPSENGEDFHSWNEAHAAEQVKEEANGDGRDEVGSHASAVSFSAETETPAECEGSDGSEVPSELLIGESSFVCTECGSRLGTKQRFKQHLALHGKELFSCLYCPACFSKSEEFTLHLASHTSEKFFLCVQCRATFRDKECFLRHMSSHSGQSQSTAGQNLGSQPSESLAEKSFCCDKCPATFKREANFTKHMIAHFNKISCAHCPATFTNEQDLDSHLVKHKNLFAGKQFSCTQCTATFRTDSHLKKHSVTHFNKRLFSCAHCSATFTKKRDVYNHLFKHKNLFLGKPFACTQCTATFRTDFYLKQHSITHSNKSAERYKDYTATINSVLSSTDSKF